MHKIVLILALLSPLTAEVLYSPPASALPSGGLPWQVLQLNTDLDPVWVSPDDPSAFTVGFGSTSYSATDVGSALDEMMSVFNNYRYGTDGDQSSSNEIQTLALSNGTLSLSNGGGSVEIAPPLTIQPATTLTASYTTPADARKMLITITDDAGGEVSLNGLSLAVGEYRSYANDNGGVITPFLITIPAGSKVLYEYAN